MAKAVATRQLTGIVVSHTHWDREWYLSFQRFRMMLVDLVDALLDILDQDPEFRYFTLDGQTVVVEDYLEIRPHNAERLAKYVRAGRVLIGPWYVLPDEFLVSAESLVRNLLIGRQVARPFGPTMPVGYLPDTFGHPAQMPQILRRWGLDNAVLFRGVIPPASEFLWQAPDGSQVLTCFLPGGYCNAAGLAASPDRFLEGRFTDLVTALKAAATTSNILLMNGCDHFPPRRQLQSFLEKGAPLVPDVALRQGTLPEYVQLVKAEQPHLEILTGEFRQPRPGRVTPGVLSARMYLKQQNFHCTNLLERYAEPLAALAWLIGIPHPDNYLSLAWKQVLQNHPHDSICGCSIDPVHRDMLTRFHYAQDVGGELVRRSLASIAESVAANGGSSGFLAFNPTGRPRHDYARQILHFVERGKEFRLADASGRPVAYQIVSRRDVIVQYQTYSQAIELDGRSETANPVITAEQMATLISDGLWQSWEGEAVEILFLASLPASGFATFRVLLDPAPESSTKPGTDLRGGEDWLENGLLRVETGAHGELSVLDKRSSVVYGPLNVFEDGGDRGDEYTYCPPERDSVLRSDLMPAAIRLAESGPVRATLEITSRLRVPRRLGPTREQRDSSVVELTIVSRVSLSAGSPRVEVTTEVENTAEDHRLRVLAYAPLVTDVSHAHGQFDVTRRPVDMDSTEVGRVPGNDEEVAVTTFPQATFVDVNDGAQGLAVLNRGLPEFEALRAGDGTVVALTLLRCVGWLSRPDLATRFGNAGPMLETPDAQCQGRHTFHYAFVPHPGDWAQAAIADEADRFASPAIGISLFARAMHNGLANHARPQQRLPETFSVVAVEPSEVVLSAVKKAADEEALVVRVYNTFDRAVMTRLTFGLPVQEVRTISLAETDLGQPPLALEGRTSVEFLLGAHEIRTLRLK